MIAISFSIIGCIFQSYTCFGNDISDSLKATKTAIKKEVFYCPEGCKEVIERWSLAGYSRYCIKNGYRHGKWIAFENKRLAIKGNYSEGKKDGQWIWYHNDGRVFRIIEYKDGIEMSDIVIDSGGAPKIRESDPKY